MPTQIRFTFLLVILLVACTAVPDTEVNTAVPTRTPATIVTSTAVLTPTSPMAVPPTEASPRPTPTTETTTPAIQFGQPFWLGRGVIQDAAFLPGGEQVAVGWANELSLFNVADAAERWHVSFAAPLIAITVHPQGTAVAAALTDGTIVVVDAATGQAQPFPFAAPNAYWGDVAWSPDGRTIAFQFIGPRRGDPIYLLNVADGVVTEVPDTTLPEGTRPYLVWSPDSQTLTLPSLGEVCGRLVHVITGDTFLPLAHEGGCYDSYAVTWSPDGETLALATSNETHLLDGATFAVQQRLPGSPLSFNPVPAGDPLTFSADGRTLCSKGGFGFYGDFYPFKVWEVAMGELVGQQGEDGVVPELEGENPHRMGVICDGHTITSLFRDGRITQWSPQPGIQTVAEETISAIPVISPLYQFVWSADGRKIAAFNGYLSTAVWDVASGRLEANFDIFGGIPALSADGRLVALDDWENSEIAIYDLETQQLLNRLPEATTLPRDAFSPDGSLLAYGSGHQVRLAEPLTGAVTAVLDGHPTDSTIRRVFWSPDSSALVTAGAKEETGELILWERTAVGDYQETFRSQTVRAGYDFGVVLAAFNPSGNLVAMENMVRPEAGQAKIAIYDREAGSAIRWLTEYELAAWVSDEILLTAEAQYNTRLTQWHVRTGEQTIGWANNAGGHAYAPNGLFFARQNDSGSIGREVDILYWRSGQLIERLPVGNDILQISWSPDGRYLAALAVDGAIRVWPVAATDD
ncbi:MAG TPA: WD40 repeat domain-containing protein [Chloroflexota bacterium]|nr:WD40 repeat domain-containing protein [Chloroflexota bacterium]